MGRQLGFGRGRDCGGRAVWEKAGPAEAPVPPWSSYCPIEQRFWSLGLALSFFLGLSAHQLVRSLELREEVMH